MHANFDPATGFVVRSWDFPVAVAAGEPAADVIAEAVADAGSQDDEWHVLAAGESLASVESALRGWARRGVTLHSRPDGAPVSEVKVPTGFELSVAPEGWEAGGLDIGHLPPSLLREYRTPWVRGRPVAAALFEGKPVSFCYVGVATESLWDVAVDTLEGFRQRGLAAACFVTLAKHLAGRGLQPVWGSLDTHRASMRLAARLGFRAEAHLTSFVQPRGG